MNKISIICITQFIEKIDGDNYCNLFDLVQEISKWLTKSVIIIGELKTFNEVQQGTSMFSVSLSKP